MTNQEYATKVLDYVLHANANGECNRRFHKIDMVDGQFFWETDEDGDQPMDGKDIVEMFEQNEKNKVDEKNILDLFDVENNDDENRWEFTPKTPEHISYTVSYDECPTLAGACLAVNSSLKRQANS